MINEKKISICSRTFYNNLDLRRKLEKLFKNIKFNKSKKSLEGKSLVNFLKGSEIALVGLEKMNQKTLGQLPDLKVIVKYGVGLDKIDLKYLKKNKKIHFINYENSLRKQYIIFIRENYTKKDVNDIFNSIKKVDSFYKI